MIVLLHCGVSDQIVYLYCGVLDHDCFTALWSP